MQVLSENIDASHVLGGRRAKRLLESVEVDLLTSDVETFFSERCSTAEAVSAPSLAKAKPAILADLVGRGRNQNGHCTRRERDQDGR